MTGTLYHTPIHGPRGSSRFAADFVTSHLSVAMQQPVRAAVISIEKGGEKSQVVTIARMLRKD